VNVECKLSLKPLKHEYITRDWLTRDADVIVTNNIFNVRREDRQLIKESGKTLLSTDDLPTYLVEIRNKLILGKGMDGKMYSIYSKLYPSQNTSFPILNKLKNDISSSVDLFLGSKEILFRSKCDRRISKKNDSLNVATLKSYCENLLHNLKLA